MQTVAVIDYGMGNLHSVAKALEHVGAGRVLITSDAHLLSCRDELPVTVSTPRELVGGSAPRKPGPGNRVEEEPCPS